MNGFTLRIFVPSGDPEGVRIFDRMNWTGRGYALPRDRWAEVKSRAELSSPGVYILLGYEADEIGAEQPVAYIGQTDNIRARIETHDLKRDFWDYSLFFLSTNHGLNRAHTTWLEWELIRRAANAKRCRLENKAEPSEPNLIESEKADTGAFLNEMLRILPVMGVHIFEPVKLAAPSELAAAGLQPSTDERKDVIVVPAQREGFERAFLNQDAWWAIRVAEKHRSSLRWIAAYQVAPIASITHLAEIDRFEPYGDTGKWKVVFKRQAVPLDQPIPFANATSGTMQGPRYTTLASLKAAKTIRDLFS
jgi:hypothetical protein